VAEIEKWPGCERDRSNAGPWYADKESGTTLQRPDFDRLQRTSSTDGQNVVLWKLDRLSRRLKDESRSFADWCERGLKIVVVTQQIELNGAVGRMIAGLLLGLAESSGSTGATGSGRDRSCEKESA